MAAILSSSSSSSDDLHSIEWAESVPSDVMFLILDKLLEFTDLVRCAAVCKGWSSVARYYYIYESRRSRTLGPMLMILKQQQSEAHIERALLYSVSEEKVYNNFRFQIPSIIRSYGTTESHYSGAGHGWLARVVLNPSEEFHSFSKPRKLLITLLPPFRSSQGSTLPISLPQYQTGYSGNGSMREIFNTLKVVLSADPALNPDDYTVMLLIYKDLAFIRGGQKSWTVINDSRNIDAIFYKGRGHVLLNRSWRSEVITYDYEVRSPSGSPRQIASYICGLPYDHQAYLVESTQGDLLCVYTCFEQESSTSEMWTKRFAVQKLVLNDRDGPVTSKVEVQSIGEDALFLGNNSQSVSVVASKHPGCQPNCIYYAEPPLEMGIYNLEDKTIKKLCPQISWDEHVSRPLWITPTFNGLSS